ncbi:GtrA-like protein [Stenotrophomonas maltophilia]|nr:GtrA-like protein [Stenotrophomonas maltophilia]
MLIGTAVGLVTKYVLDKKFIFLYASESANQEAKTFLLYSVMGLATTAVFWATEYAFELAFDSDSMRYVGGVIGLIAGYIIKYHLDKRLVFK